VDPFRGFGTAVNVVTVLVGSGIGIVLGHRLTQRTRDTVTDALGLVTLMIATLAAAAVTSPTLTSAVGDSAPVLIVLGSMLVGGLIGSWLRIEAGLESVGDLLQRRLASSDQTEQRRRFVEGFVSSSLVFCVGPLTILGSLNDGLGNGSDQLMLKSALDGFAAMAFAAAFGWGVAAAAISVLVVQGGLTGVGALLGQLLPDPQLAALTATGGLLLAGVGLRLLQIKAVPAGDLLPALLVAPLLTELVIAIR
jgi:uncharacterized membrane protein YqgA involved in biofilm formation